MHVIMEDLQSLFNTLKEENFMNTLINELNGKKQQIQKELHAVQTEMETLKKL
jgi:hypothetical protein